jgi:Mrp family chromosome partitioning ATPase
MDHIIQALERAQQSPQVARAMQPAQPQPATRPREAVRELIPDFEVGLGPLEAKRIIAHDPGDPRTRSFDLLRTQTLQAMSANGWRLLAVTSPTAGCGKTFTAINLALSIARQPDSSVLLMDMDLQKPQLAKRFGIDVKAGLRSLLEGQGSLSMAMLALSLGGTKFRFLPVERPSSRSSDWVGSRAMSDILDQVRADESLKVVILDLPPILAGDDAMSILPRVDCMLMVAAAGATTATEIKECANYVKQTPVVRVVLNKAPEAPPAYY